MPVTVRSLAQSLRLSPATVSNALSGNGRIAESTRRRVKRAAAAVGYRHNPLAASVMAKHRRASGGTFQGVLAAVDVEEPVRKPHGAFHGELMRGARERALQLGFKLEPFVVGRAGLTMPRLDLILQSRGIYGIVVLPTWFEPDYSQLDWTRYAGTYTDYSIQHPALNCVCCDHYVSMIQTLHRLELRGYRRPGLFLEHGRDERLNHRWGAAFLAFQHNRPEIERVPLLVTPELQENLFKRWYRRYKPDVVISHFTAPLDWMEQCGARVPDVGYVCLNVLFQERTTAGLDLLPHEIGGRATESVIAQLQRNERGLPKWPTVTTTPARWVDGPTVRGGRG
jgi:DNA-binding LacI/PurR family transcriptional regulator